MCGGASGPPVYLDALPRSIPACAGEPIGADALKVSLEVYPRVCGGAIDASWLVMAAPGLSPRVRGSLIGQGPQVKLNGSIPACAGEPRSVWATASETAVYPRVCGGAEIIGKEAAANRGLSPRVRGSPQQDLVETQDHRSIPACAGEPAP